MTRLRQSGVVLTRADALEQMAAVDAAIVDKTGTLTVHDPVITGVDMAERRPPPPRAVAEGRRGAGVPRQPPSGPGVPQRLSQRRSRPGGPCPGGARRRRRRPIRGVCGADRPRSVLRRAANPTSAPFTWPWTGCRWCVSTSPIRCGRTPRAAIAGLKRAGLQVTMVSGDAPERCEALAGLLGIDFAARQAPETKLEITRHLQHQGRKVLVLGDGINDIPALAAADVSATVLESSDLVKSKCDVLLLSRRLGALVELVERQPPDADGGAPEPALGAGLQPHGHAPCGVRLRGPMDGRSGHGLQLPSGDGQRLPAADGARRAAGRPSRAGEHREAEPWRCWCC